MFALAWKLDLIGRPYGLDLFCVSGSYSFGISSRAIFAALALSFWRSALASSFAMIRLEPCYGHYQIVVQPDLAVAFQLNGKMFFGDLAFV